MKMQHAHGHQPIGHGTITRQENTSLRNSENSINVNFTNYDENMNISSKKSIEELEKYKQRAVTTKSNKELTNSSHSYNNFNHLGMMNDQENLKS